MSINELYAKKESLELELEKLQSDLEWNSIKPVVGGVTSSNEEPLTITWGNVPYMKGLSGLVFYDSKGRICSVPYINHGRSSGSFILKLDGKGKIPTGYSGNGGGELGAIPADYELASDEIKGSVTAVNTYNNSDYYCCTYPLRQNPGSSWSWGTQAVGSLTYTLEKFSFSKISFICSPFFGGGTYQITIKVGENVIYDEPVLVNGTRSEIIIETFSSQSEKDLKLKEITDSIASKTQELNQTIQTINTILQNAAAELEVSKKELQKKQEELAKKQSELAQLEADNEVTLREIENLKQQEALLQEQIVQLEAQITQVGSGNNAELEALRESIADLEALKAQKEQELQDSSSQLEDLRIQKAQLETQIQELLTQAQTMQNQANLLQAETTELQNQKENAELEISQNQALKAQKEQELQVLRESMSVINAELEVLNNEITTKEAQIAQTTEQKAQLEAQREANNSKYEALRIKLESLQQEILSLQAELENASTDTIKKLEILHAKLLRIAEELGITLCVENDSQEAEEEKPEIPTTEVVIPKDFKGFHYIAKDNERLDSIVYSHYGTLNVFQSVLEVNSHLLNKKILNAGDIVLLPQIDTSIKTLDDLWN